MKFRIIKNTIFFIGFTILLICYFIVLFNHTDRFFISNEIISGILFLCLAIFLLSTWIAYNKSSEDRKLIQSQLEGEIKAKAILSTSLDDAIFVHKKYRQRSKALYGTLVDSIPQIIYRTDCLEQILFVNKSFNKYFGVNISNISGRNVYEFFNDSLAAEFRKYDRKVLDTGAMVGDIISYESNTDEKKRFIEFHKIPIRNTTSDIVGIQSIFWDITERKKAEIELKEAELKFRTLVENSLAGVYIFQEGQFKYVNPKFSQIFGYHQNEMIDRLPIEAIIFSEDQSTVLDTHQNLLSATQDSIRYELRGIRKDGTLISIEVFDSKTYYMGDIAIIGTVIDITERKNHELQLLNLFNESISQNKRLKNFAYIVSHNIRSQAANISGLIGCMSATDDEVMKKEFYEMLKISSEKLEETISDLNEITTVQNDNQKSKQILSLHKEVETITKDLDTLILQSNTTIINNIPEDLKINVVPSYLESSLLNLVSNAIKYRSPDREPVIQFSSVRDKGKIELHVKDNGIGIDLNKNGEKIFGMYKTFLNSKESRGFGLYLTKNQIEAMGGSIDVESEKGKGSVFKITFYEEA